MYCIFLIINNVFHCNIAILWRVQVEVLYVDFGDTDTVSLLVVRQFAPSLKALRDFPHQVQHCLGLELGYS